ncbi:MAG: putative ABC transporter ATP-binding protein YheS [Chlamydiae bacterium]|nr:putative ABC transporter ATP-binding protein YheS [Chlamydiota bacterium]
MFRVQDLKKSYGSDLLFEDASFQLNPGERCSLVGRNGSGKSTLLRILTGQESPDHGEIHFPKNYRLGFLQQHIHFTQPTLRQESALALPEGEEDKTYKVEAILSGLGFKVDDFDKDPNSFSGGYQLRIQLAKALAQEPDCLLLDEPTNYLDIVSVRWLIQFLRRWKGEMILISHDRTFLDAVATHTMGIHRNQLFRTKGSTSNFFEHIVQIEEVHERTRKKIEKQKGCAEKFINRFGAKATKARQAQSRRKAIERLPSLERLAELEGLDFRFNAARFPGKHLMQIENVSFRYPDMTTPLLQNLSLEIEPGDRIAIIGKNGRGKSTILRLLAGELEPIEGTIRRSENLKIGFFGQTNVVRLNENLSIEEEIARVDPSLPFSEVRRICGMMMFTQKKAEKKIGILSGGEKSRVLLGKILASSCNLLLLDEPSNHLDIESIEALEEALEDFDGSIVIVSHSEEILRRIPEKLIVCREQQQELFLGEYDYFLEKIGWEDQPKRKKKAKQDGIDHTQTSKERSRNLTPIKKQIQNEETVLAELHKELETAIANQNNKNIATISRKLGEQQKKVDTLYQELDNLYKRCV